MTGDGVKRVPNPSDIDIAQQVYPKYTDRISEVAKRAGVPEQYLEPYGFYKAKVDYNYLNEHKNDPDGKLILVTAITPTPAGEGKTTTTVGVS
ncbi:MAG: formate--tetrahydrofolate ligase, partial [Spirochaetaceae bacterium]|nr:formate--tetrahydrofolate ligase [Spirochaetaceae bacterium]